MHISTSFVSLKVLCKKKPADPARNPVSSKLPTEIPLLHWNSRQCDQPCLRVSLVDYSPSWRRGVFYSQKWRTRVGLTTLNRNSPDLWQINGHFSVLAAFVKTKLSEMCMYCRDVLHVFLFYFAQTYTLDYFMSYLAEWSQLSCCGNGFANYLAPGKCSALLTVTSLPWNQYGPLAKHRLCTIEVIPPGTAMWEQKGHLFKLDMNHFWISFASQLNSTPVNKGKGIQYDAFLQNM